MERQQLSTPRAYKRSPALTNSKWYKGMLHSQMAGTADNNGAFDLVISKMRRGTEPPPHVHSREDEFFYVLSGEMRAYVDGEVFTVTAGECMFLPRRKPHAWLITSEEIYTLAVVTAMSKVKRAAFTPEASLFILGLGLSPSSLEQRF